MNYLFDKNWFVKHQHKLLWFLNTPLIRVWFRRVMRIRKYDCKEKITQITPNSISWGDKLIWNTKKRRLEIERTTDFRTHNKYSKRLYHAFKYVWYLFHAWDLGFANIFAPQLNLGFDTLTVYPDAHTETTTVDGNVIRNDASGEQWSTIVNGAGTAAYPSATSGYCPGFSMYGSSDADYIYRGVTLFDTSDIVSEATITSVVLSVWVVSKTRTNGTDSGFNIVACNPASNTDLVASDYNIARWGSTKFISDKAIDSITTGQYLDNTLNDDGIANVTKEGISKYGFRMVRDISGSSPGVANIWVNHNITVYFSDQTGTTTDPKLVVTYSVVSNTGNFFQFLS